MFFSTQCPRGVYKWKVSLANRKCPEWACPSLSCAGRLDIYESIMQPLTNWFPFPFSSQHLFYARCLILIHTYLYRFKKAVKGMAVRGLHRWFIQQGTQYRKITVTIRRKQKGTTIGSFSSSFRFIRYPSITIRCTRRNIGEWSSKSWERSHKTLQSYRARFRVDGLAPDARVVVLVQPRPSKIDRLSCLRWRSTTLYLEPCVYSH